MNDTATDLLADASVVVIGGGVMGCSTLYHLAREGVTDAVLLERNQLTSGTTWHSAAQVRALRSTRNLTTRGTIRCNAIALCTGLWSRATAAMAGAIAPVWPCEHFYLLAQPIDGITGNLPTLGDHDGQLYIRDEGIKSRIVTILPDDTPAVPLGSEPVYAQGRIVGKTTSAVFGYRIARPLALADIDAALGEGDPVEIDIARQMWPGRVTLRPAFDPTGTRMRPAKGT